MVTGEQGSSVINFFETLRMELGWDIGITIATPGFVKTDLTLRAMEFEVGLVQRTCSGRRVG